MTQHTPGPWQESGSRWILRQNPDEKPIAEVLYPGETINHESVKEGQANANLIAAAPDLLDTLERVEWISEWANIEYHGKRSCPWCHRLEDMGHAADCLRQLAVAKAKGETNR